MNLQEAPVYVQILQPGQDLGTVVAVRLAVKESRAAVQQPAEPSCSCREPERWLPSLTHYYGDRKQSPKTQADVSASLAQRVSSLTQDSSEHLESRLAQEPNIPGSNKPEGGQDTMYEKVVADAEKDQDASEKAAGSQTGSIEEVARQAIAPPYSEPTALQPTVGSLANRQDDQEPKA